MKHFRKFNMTIFVCVEDVIVTGPFFLYSLVLRDCIPRCEDLKQSSTIIHKRNP